MVQRKKIQEAELYSKMLSKISSEFHKRIIESCCITGQTLIKKSNIKKINDHRIKIRVVKALKRSLLDIEAEISTFNIPSHLPHNNKNSEKTNSSLSIAEKKRMSLTRIIIRNWIQKAQSLANDENLKELNLAVNEYLSPKLTETRDNYLLELNKISTKKFNEKIIQNGLDKAKSIQSITNSMITTGSSVRILVPMKALIEKLRALGVINKITTKPAGNMKFTSFKDSDIIQ